jgi:DNA-binding response OmpR family regulator
MIVAHVWDHDDTVRPATLRVFVNQLRRKLHADASPSRLLTEPGVGCRL